MNVGYDLTEQQLRDFFNQYGTVTDVYLPKHKSGRNKGFGFTTFDSEEGLRSALSAQEYIIGGDVVKINRAGPRPEFEASLSGAEPVASGASSDAINRQPQLFGKGPRLYVGGVPEELTEERLKAHFSRWGNVVDLYFPGKKGQSRVNYCFVTFDNWRAAQTACNQSERNIDGMVGLLVFCHMLAYVLSTFQPCTALLKPSSNTSFIHLLHICLVCSRYNLSILRKSVLRSRSSKPELKQQR